MHAIASHPAGSAVAGRHSVARRVARATAGLLVLIAAAARAEAPPAPVRLGDAGAGALMLRTETPGLYLPAPMVRTDVRMTVSGLVNRVSVSQRFYNPTDGWVEGVYVFPLPEGAAVDRLRLQIGERFIEGRIERRAEAKRIYDQAKAKGQRASLVEQERPNMFTSSVANMGPGEDVVVRIEYQESLRYDSGGFSLRFPMVAGPRYVPGAISVASASGTGWAAATDRVPDADRITPPVLPPSLGKINPVSMEVTLDAGFPLERLASPTHDVAVTEEGEGRRRIAFREGTVPADRDFVLEWRPGVGAAPAIGLFSEAGDGIRHALVMVMPPTEGATERQTPPREVVFVIDTSGSMSGVSIKGARAALLMALDRLRPRDRFNVIQFNSRAERLFPEARAADESALAEACGYVAGLGANGGTEMLAALRLALDGRRDAARLRQVVFLTDGSVGNEAELFGEVQARLGDSRLFTVGIGSAPNGYFMVRAAEIGHGTYTYVAAVDEVRARMSALFAKLETPVVTDIAVSFPGAAEAEAWPRVVPDLYQGEPVVVAARLAGAAKAVVTGRYDGRPWSLELDLAGGREGAGIAALWARRKIAALMDGLHEGRPEAEVRDEVTRIALAHHLVSRYTSLVAVDVTPARSDDKPVATGAVPLNLPAGWDYDKVFGDGPVEKTRWRLQRAAAPDASSTGVAVPAALRVAEAVQVRAGAAAPTLQQLPQGATGATRALLLGLALLLLGLAVWRWRRRAA